MNIAVTDACIFIDLFLLEIHAEFFDLPYSIHTTHDVLGELNEEQQLLLRDFISSEKLTVHNLDQNQRLELLSQDFPRSLSDPDRTVFFIAQQLNAMVLSSDKALRNWAKVKDLDYHGILWVLETLVNQDTLSRALGMEKLVVLFQVNPTMAGSKEVLKKVEELKQSWRIEFL
jgi:hypothetical protein